MAPGLSPQLNQELQAALLNCGPFTSGDNWQAVFADERISAWRHRLPDANSSAARVQAIVDFLNHRQNEQGENALVLLLRVLGELIPAGDSCHERLLALADTLEVEQKQRKPTFVRVLPGGSNTSLAPVPIELQELFAAGQVGLFASHRLSEEAGLASHRELADALSRRLGEPGVEVSGSGADLPEVAQLYEAARGRHALLSYLRERLDTTRLQPAAVHRAIAQLPIHIIFSTAHDDLLEDALRQAGRRVNKVTADSMLTHASSDRVQLLKLKGDVELPETVVITRRDLEHYTIKHPLIVNHLRDRLSSMTFLLLGYQANDPDLKLLFEQSGYQRGGGRLHYALMDGISALQKQVLRDRHVQVIDVEHERVASWLEVLASSRSG